MSEGHLIISLDYELSWGLLGYNILKRYDTNILNVPRVIDLTLSKFREYDIGCTWAFVGLLQKRNTKEVKDSVSEFPNTIYNGSSHCPIRYIRNLNDSFNTALHLDQACLELIHEAPRQYLASHSFLHIYTHILAQKEMFELDCRKFMHEYKFQNNRPIAYVFPQNRVSEEYLGIISDYGFRCYRGNEDSILYSRKYSFRTLLRIGRGLDSIMNLTGNHLFDPPCRNHEVMNIPSSRFLSPASKIEFITKLKIRRIKKSMTKAAKEGKAYHLWWHPHNFGGNINANMLVLEEILSHYQFLNEKHNFTSLSMEEYYLKYGG